MVGIHVTSTRVVGTSESNTRLLVVVTVASLGIAGTLTVGIAPSFRLAGSVVEGFSLSCTTALLLIRRQTPLPSSIGDVLGVAPLTSTSIQETETLPIVASS